MTTTLDELSEALHQFIGQSTQIKRDYGYLGHPNGTIDVPGRPGRVYVRIVKGENISVTDALGLNVARKLNLPIEIVYSKTGDRIIDGVNVAEAIETMGKGIESFGVGRHSHALGTGLEYYTDGRLLIPGLVHYQSGLVIRVERLTYQWLGEQKRWGGGTIDLTSYLPATASTWRWAKVGLDPVSNTIAVTTGIPVGLGTPLTYSRLSAIDFSNKIPLAGVILRNGATTIDNESDYEDLRDWFDFTPSSEVLAKVALTTLSFDTTSTATTLAKSVLNGELIREVAIIIDTPFNGTVTLKVGDSGDNSRLLSTGQNDPYLAGEYTSKLAYPYPSDASVNLYMTQSGTTAGAGRVVILSTVP